MLTIIIKLNNKILCLPSTPLTCMRVSSRRTFQLCLPLTLSMIERVREPKKKSKRWYHKEVKTKGRKKVICWYLKCVVVCTLKKQRLPESFILRKVYWPLSECTHIKQASEREKLMKISVLTEVTFVALSLSPYPQLCVYAKKYFALKLIHTCSLLRYIR